MSVSESIPLPQLPFRPDRVSSTNAKTSAGPQSQSRPSFAIAYTQPPPPLSPTRALKTSSKPSATNASPPSISRIPPQPPSHPLPNYFVAPAHPQSHHLHSLPPREKTTRTLILDHTAWQHARTRFAQGRCELGMRVGFKERLLTERESGINTGTGERDAFSISAARSGGTHIFGNLPEVELASSEDEGEDEGRESDGESISVLNYGTWRDGKDKDVDSMVTAKETDKDDSIDVDRDTSEQPMSNDTTLAPALAARAIGIEKVLHAMLSQPPSPPPRSPSPTHYALHSSHAHSQHYRAPPSASAPASTPATKPSPHALPNGVRLRLALLALVNDLFERQSPFSSELLSLSPTRPQTAYSPDASQSTKAVGVLSPPCLPTQLPPLSLPPPNVLPPALAALTQISSQPPNTPAGSTSFHTLTHAGASAILSPISGTGIRGQSSTQNKDSAGDGQMRRPPPLFTWTHLSRDSTSPASPDLPVQFGSPSREVGLDKTSVASPISPSTSRSLPTSWKSSTPRYHSGAKVPTASSSVGLARRALGRARELYTAGCYPSSIPLTTGNRGSYRGDVTIYGGTPTLTTTGYPMRKFKTLCPRHLLEKCTTCTPSKKQASRIGAGLLRKITGCGALGGGVLADMVPRFLRLSALIAIELGREACGEETGPESGKDVSPSAASFARPAQPTRAWYALLCGLLTRAVLEGYVARGWRGAEHVEVLMGVGVGLGVGRKTRRSTAVEEADAGEFEPDEMPGLVEAGKVLFVDVLEDDGAEYTAEMEMRLSEFLTVPHTTSDLATHLTALSAQYPAAPVERAALRFCEAAAKWRGRPELETYKAAARATSGTLSMHSLLASPAPRRPPIEQYFRVAPGTNLRKHPYDGEGNERAAKREKVDDPADVDAEWVGPYGV